MSNQQGDFNVAIQNLREDIKEIRAESRQDIKDLETKTETWHKEVRGEFTDVKKRLDTIETQITTKADAKKFGAERMAAWGAILLVAVSVFSLGFKISTYHQETISQVELNRHHMDSTAEETLKEVEHSKDRTK